MDEEDPKVRQMHLLLPVNGGKENGADQKPHDESGNRQSVEPDWRREVVDELKRDGYYK